MGLRHRAGLLGGQSVADVRQSVREQVHRIQSLGSELERRVERMYMFVLPFGGVAASVLVTCSGLLFASYASHLPSLPSK